MTDEMKLVRCGCGGEARVSSYPYGQLTKYRVKCEKCGMLYSVGKYTEAEAIEAWNRSMGAERGLDEWCTDCKEYDQDKQCCHRWTKVIRRTVEEMKTNWRWIPVSEALPEERKKVLVTTIDGDIKVSYRSDVTYWWNIGRGNVLAWMPLPEPLKGE